MSKLQMIDAAAFEKLLLKLGFCIVRQKGSHIFYRHPDGRYTTLPHHKGIQIGRSLLRHILREINITVEDYNAIIQEK